MVMTDGEGYIDQALDVAVARTCRRATTCLQFQVRGRLAGLASARLLAPGAAAVVVRSDVDLTYLDTDFMSTTGKLNLLIQRAAERNDAAGHGAGLPGAAARGRLGRRPAADVPERQPELLQDGAGGKGAARRHRPGRRRAEAVQGHHRQQAERRGSGRRGARAGGAGGLQADRPAAAAAGRAGRHAGDPDGRRQRGGRGGLFAVPPVHQPRS